MSQTKDSFLKIFNDLQTKCKLVKPRGLLVKEIENYLYVLPPYVRFCNFKERKLSLNYIKKEFLWYLKGDRYDTSITEHASMWKSLINKDGSINSNYGQYLFHWNWHVLIKELLKDKDSRRASIMILNNDHLIMETNDVPCTYGLNFRIREDKLNMTVQMRSQDAFFGMGNDCPAFSFVHEMVYTVLKDKYTDLKLGNYTHFANSFHIYERHFEALDSILKNQEFEEITIPRMENADEISGLITGQFKDYKFTNWLLGNEEEE